MNEEQLRHVLHSANLTSAAHALLELVHLNQCDSAIPLQWAKRRNRSPKLLVRSHTKGLPSVLQSRQGRCKGRCKSRSPPKLHNLQRRRFRSLQVTVYSSLAKATSPFLARFLRLMVVPLSLRLASTSNLPFSRNIHNQHPTSERWRKRKDVKCCLGLMRRN